MPHWKKEEEEEKGERSLLQNKSIRIVQYVCAEKFIYMHLIPMFLNFKVKEKKNISKPFCFK